MKTYIIGDSISIQYGPYLASYLDIPQGANGGNSAMVLSFLKSKAEAGGVDADLLLLNCGLHDIKTNPENANRQISIDRYKENLEAIVDAVNAMKCSLVWIRTTPCDEKVHNHVREKQAAFIAGWLMAYQGPAQQNGDFNVSYHYRGNGEA